MEDQSYLHFKVGSTVLLSRKSSFCRQVEKDITGMITSIYRPRIPTEEEMWAKVTFENGYSNNYPLRDLILVAPRLKNNQEAYDYLFKN